ncbi:neuromedin-U isoform X1 [Vanacampus margaritifer]
MQTKQKTRAASSSSKSSLTKLSGGNVSAVGAAGVSLAALLVLVNVPLIHSARLEPQQASVDQRKLLGQIDAACSSFFSADVQASDILGEICFLMLVQKFKVDKEVYIPSMSYTQIVDYLLSSQELKGQEKNNKRSPALPPLLHLGPHLHTRRQRGISVQAELEGPGGIQSRGYFLYRPRNGRRVFEYE